MERVGDALKSTSSVTYDWAYEYAGQHQSKANIDLETFLRRTYGRRREASLTRLAL